MPMTESRKSSLFSFNHKTLWHILPTAFVFIRCTTLSLKGIRSMCTSDLSHHIVSMSKQFIWNDCGNTCTKKGVTAGENRYWEGWESSHIFNTRKIADSGSCCYVTRIIYQFPFDELRSTSISCLILHVSKTHSCLKTPKRNWHTKKHNT